MLMLPVSSEMEVYSIQKVRVGVVPSISLALTVAGEDGTLRRLDPIAEPWPLPGAGRGHPGRDAWPLAALIAAVGGDPATMALSDLGRVLKGKRARMRILGGVLVSAAPA